MTDAIARRRGVTIPDKLRVMPPTTETTVAPDTDPAPLVQPTHVLVEQFQKSFWRCASHRNGSKPREQEHDDYERCNEG